MGDTPGNHPDHTLDTCVATGKPSNVTCSSAEGYASSATVPRSGVSGSLTVPKLWPPQNSWLEPFTFTLAAVRIGFLSEHFSTGLDTNHPSPSCRSRKSRHRGEGGWRGLLRDTLRRQNHCKKLRCVHPAVHSAFFLLLFRTASAVATPDCWIKERGVGARAEDFTYAKEDSGRR